MERYAAAGGQPVHLRSLRCGQAVHPINHDSLAELASLRHMEKVEICNHKLWGAGRPEKLIELYPSDGSRSGIIFQSFGPRNCPNLRRFSVSQHVFDVYEIFCAVHKKPQFPRKLAVFIEKLDRPDHGEPWFLLSNPRLNTQVCPSRCECSHFK